MKLINKLDEFTVKQSVKQKEEYTKTALSPTDALDCPRKTFYKWHKYTQEETDTRSLRIFALGNYIHNRWQDLLDEMGLQLKREFRIDTTHKGIPIHGYVDSICSIDGQLYVVEFKSQKDWMYGKTDYLQDAKPEHRAQVQLYMHFTGIHKAIILYENKNTSELREFQLSYDENFVTEILNSFEKLYSQINLNELPEKISGAKLDKYPCAYCGFRQHCFPSQEVVTKD